MIKKASADIAYVLWRGGRPRFLPGPWMRPLGYKSHNLRHPDGRWFTFEEAASESDRIRDEAKLRKEQRDTGIKLARLKAPLLGKTFGQLCEDCFTLPEFKGREILDGRKKRKGLSPKTVDGYRKSKNATEQACARLAAAKKADSLWDAPAAAITPKLAQTLIDEVERHSGLHQARAVRAFVSQMWSRLAVKEPGVIRSLWSEIDRLPVPEGRVRAWSIEEFICMVETADNLNALTDGKKPDRPEMGDSFVLGVLTVLRQTDRLQLSAVSDQGSHLVVTTSKSQNYDKPFIVELLKTPLLVRRLAAASLRRKAWKKQPIKPWPHLLLDEVAEAPWHPSGDHYRKVFAAVRAEAAKRLASCAEIRDQDLRDTALTWLDRIGIDDRTKARLAGHSPETSAAIQAKHYIERDRRAADAGMTALGNLLEGKV